MTQPLAPPPKKNPERRTPVPMLPPGTRSRAGLGLALAAGQGRFALQVCTECGAVQYPPRDACHQCLATDLAWRDLPSGGQLLAETTIHASSDPYFRERLPWRAGTVQLDAGPVVLAHIHGDVARGARVRMALMLDRAGQGVLVALPEQETPHMQDDTILRAMGTHPRHRRVLITDARAPEAVALARALLDAGVAQVFMGLAEAWRPFPGRTRLEALDKVSLHRLDVTDAESLTDLAGAIGGKVDILINNARHIRPGGVIGASLTDARDSMEIGALGLMRLAQAFGPGMRARGADGVNSAVAWVNVLPAQALAHDPGFAGAVAAGAAARALSLSLRAELRGGGIRLLHVHAGPMDDEWHQPLPPPKLAPAALARAIVQGLEQGLEEIHAGDVARDLAQRFAENPALLAREMEGGA
ncbi:MAG: SDR family oxidoreductase [Pararhodobacter sp.]|nr:SDR family oxidoreductase [Pararhodobacter sp.]